MPQTTERFRIESTRLKEWNYSTPWWYYVTINTKDHISCLGDVVKGKMILGELGKIAEDEWLKTKELRANVDLDYFVIMPNHVHGIIILTDYCKDVARNVSTENSFSRISPKPGSLATIIRSFKSSVTKQIHEIGCHNFSWQARFYDRIIRNEKELYNIKRYIEQNPLKWEFEKNNAENIYDF